MAIIALFASLQACAGVVAEIPVQYRDGYLWLNVEVAGHSQPLHFILDSGAAASVLDIHAAQALRVAFGRSVTVQGVHSQMAGRWVERFEARAEGIALPKRLLACDLRAVGGVWREPVDGLLGADFFRNRVVEIDYAAGMLRVLSSAAPGAGGAVLPMRSRNGAFCVPVAVAGASPRWARVDTGCDSSLEWVVEDSEPHGGAGLSVGLTSAATGSVSTQVRLGGLSLSDVKAGVHSQPLFSGEAGLLGNALLSRFRVIFDAPGDRLLLENR